LCARTEEGSIAASKTFSNNIEASRVQKQDPLFPAVLVEQHTRTVTGTHILFVGSAYRRDSEKVDEGGEGSRKKSLLDFILPRVFCSFVDEVCSFFSLV
jgi:hypothetical protein